MFDRAKYTREELFVSIALNLIFSENIITRHKIFKYLKNLPPDLIRDTQLRTIIEVVKEACGKGNGELKDANALYQKVVSRIADLSTQPQGKKKVSASYFGMIYALASFTDALVSTPFFHELAVELLNKWKEEKRKTIKEILVNSKDLTEDQLSMLIRELMEIENYSPFPDIQENMEEEKLIALAAKPEDFEIEAEYLYEEFLPKKTVNLWVAPASQGKSALALFLSCYLLETGRVEKVFYLDGDNPKPVLVKRGIKKILFEKYKDRFFYYDDLTSNQMYDLLLKMECVKGNALIIVDTLRALVGPKNINKGEEAEKIMAVFRSIVNSGEKTIVILHHVNKPPVNGNGNGYTLGDRIKGATEFRDRCDVAYFLTLKDKEDGNLYITLENVKQRLPVKYKIHFKVDTLNQWVEEISEVLTREEKVFVKAVLEILEQYEMGMKHPNKYQLEQKLREQGFGRNQIRAWLDKFNNKFWRQSYDTLYNQIVFKTIRKAVERFKTEDYEGNVIPRRTGELRNNACFTEKEGNINKWQTGELRNDGDLEGLTPEQQKAVLEWGANEGNNIPRRTGELRNNQSSPAEESNITPRRTGELRNDGTSPVRHPENSPETLINSKFASSPPYNSPPPSSQLPPEEESLDDDIDLTSLPPEVLYACFPTEKDREKLSVHLKQKIKNYVKTYQHKRISILKKEAENAEKETKELMKQASKKLASILSKKPPGGVYAEEDKGGRNYARENREQTQEVFKT